MAELVCEGFRDVARSLACRDTAEELPDDIFTKVKVTEVVLDKIAYGWSPEETHFQHPHLSWAQLCAALTYYYENQSDLDAQIRGGPEVTGELASQVADADFRRKLADLKRLR